MRLRHVVSCFLTNPADGTVLLGRRSERVGTYPGHWAAISGSVEAEEPLQQARREIEEETGLAAEQVELAARGRPVRFADWPLGTFWVVHPFLFRCLAPQAVRPDWEHVRFEWTPPSSVERLRTVPKLREAYEAARQGMPSAEATFREVAQDREHGAEELGLWTLEGLQAVLAQQPPADAPQAVLRACRNALSLRPSMAPVRSAALSVSGLCRRLEARAPEEAVRALRAGISRLMRSREDAPLAAAAAAAALLPDEGRVLTLSRSFTVLCTLRQAAGRLARLVVAESRPACEGRETARLAASFGIPTELLTDAAAARALEESDVLLFGADALCADGAIVNKAGTFALCCAARWFGVRALCVTTESKALPAGHRPAMEEMGPQELGEAIVGVRVRNPWFEMVPADLAGTVVWGVDQPSPGALAARAQELRTLQDALLGGPA